MNLAPSSLRLELRPGGPLAGEFQPPGDKSVTHRALLFGLLAPGLTRITNPNPGRDAEATLQCCEQLGARVVRDLDGSITVEGRDFTLAEPERVLDCGNSGTTLRLLAGILAAQPFVSVLQGDASLNRRPVARIMEPLQRMGASLWARGGDAYPPLAVRGGRLVGVDTPLRVASAQVASCVLLAGLFADGVTTVRLPGPARDHTERMLAAVGVRVDMTPTAAGGRDVRLEGPARFVAHALRVPGDPSAAAFFLAAAAATPGSRITATGMSLNPTRTGLLDALELMGARVLRTATGEMAGEPAGDVTVEGPERLVAVDVPEAWVPRMIDEVPAWAVAAARAAGVSRLRGAMELRVKESDRLESICANLGRVGITAHERNGGFDIEGGSPRGGHVDAQGDHRIAMAFAVLAHGARGGITIDGAEGIGTSDPGFVDTLAALGGHVTVRAMEPAA